MTADTTTFLAAYLSLFALVGLYVWRLQRIARRLEERLEDLERQEPAP